MSFWGIEVKPDKPHPYHSDNVEGKLLVTQATLGPGTSSDRCILQCSVGHKNPIYLCCLLPNKSECCSLNLEFKDELVAFSIVGSRSIHLSGFFVSDDGENLRDDYDWNYSDEGDDVTDSEAGFDSSDEENGSYEYNDSMGSDDDAFLIPSSVRNSGVVIEEIKEEIPLNGEKPKRKKNKKNRKNGNETTKQIICKSNSSAPPVESEDEDGFPISTSKGVEKVDSETRQDINLTGKKRTSKENDEGGPKSKKKKKKENHIDSEVRTASEPVPAPTNVETKPELPNAEKKKRAKKKKMKKQVAVTETPNITTEEDEKDTKPSQVRTFANGLVIEEKEMGLPGGKRASDGTKVGVRYIGKIKKDGKIFDSNVSGRPFEFRLGIGEVIKGWDVGIKGMRVGDKRRLIIPPSMGYGSKGAGGKIPPNAWLQFDVELLTVR